MQRCVHCRKGDGSFYRATYTGAPRGGVSVHVKCLKAFFARLDREWWWHPEWNEGRTWKLGDDPHQLCPRPRL